MPAQETYTYNNRLQPVMIQVGQYQGNLSAFSCTVYNYYAGSSNASSCAAPSNPSGTNNGNVMGYYYADNFQSNFSHLATYCYDSLNRLSGALTQSLGAGAPTNCSGSSSIWGLSYGYDRYANLTSATSTAGSPPTLSLGVNTSTNQITNSYFTYDAAGNLTQDGTGTLTHTYQWDGEGHLASVDVGGSAVCGNGATVCYTYNALGQRVQGVYSGSAYPGTFEWLFDVNGGELDECDASYDSGGRCWNASWVRLGARSIADYAATNITAFNHVDNLASTVFVTAQDGTVASDQRYYPFGQNWLRGGPSWWDVHFAGMQFPETNFGPWLMPTDFRKYHPTLGRWLSPDPLGGHISNPQSFNRYAYVLNNPTSMTDPLGLLPYAGSTPSCGSIPSGIELGGAALAGYAQCLNWWKMWASSGQSEGCMAGEYGCGSQNPTYGEDIFDALAGDSGTKVWVDANGNIGFTVNINPNFVFNQEGAIPGLYQGELAIQIEADTIGTRWNPAALFSAASDSGFSIGSNNQAGSAEFRSVKLCGTCFRTCWPGL